MLGRASQEVMPGKSSGEVMLTPTRQEAKRKERSPTRLSREGEMDEI